MFEKHLNTLVTDGILLSASATCQIVAPTVGITSTKYSNATRSESFAATYDGDLVVSATWHAAHVASVSYQALMQFGLNVANTASMLVGNGFNYTLGNSAGMTIGSGLLPPKDYDPSHRNAAPGDQQAGNSPRCDEVLVLRNLHPKLPELTTRLPGLCVRLAILRESDSLGEAEDVAMRLDTVVVLPDEDQLVQVWRGVVPCRTHDPEVECAVGKLDARPEDQGIAARLRKRFQDEAGDARKKQEK